MFALNRELKQSDIESLYFTYQKIQHRHIIRYIFLIIRYYDFHPYKKYKEIPKFALKAIREVSFPYLAPLLYEKASTYFLLNKPYSVKKFCFFQFSAAINYRTYQNLDLRKNALFCFGVLYRIFEINKNWTISNQLLNSNLGELCLHTEYYEGSLKFYKQCLNFNKSRKDDQDAVLIRHFLKSHSSLKNKLKESNPNAITPEIDEISVIEVINTSMIIIEEQDKNLLAKKDWIYFNKYDINYQEYVKLNELDKGILENIDNMIAGKQKPYKRIHKFDTNRRIYCKLVLKNALNVK